MVQATYNQLKQYAAHLPSDVLNRVPFNDAIKIACEMLYNEEWEDCLQVYATLLLEEMRKKYPEKWNSSWRYDALLGFAYDIILDYDERYAAYKRAFKKVSPQPPELLVAMAGCCWAPGKPPVTHEEAIVLVKQAIKTVPYIEAIEKLRGLYKSIGNSKEQKKWETILEGVKKTGFHLPELIHIPEDER